MLVATFEEVRLAEEANCHTEEAGDLKFVRGH